jgi:hypothetical protein
MFEREISEARIDIFQIAKAKFQRFELDLVKQTSK